MNAHYYSFKEIFYIDNNFESPQNIRLEIVKGPQIRIIFS